MKLKRLGRSPLMVTELGLGTMTWGSQNTEAEGHAQIDLALESGINFIDTAELYAVPPRPETHGATETIIGNWFAKTGKRDKWILASKIAGGGNAHIRGGTRPSRDTVAEALEASLRRLRTDYIDLYQVHWPARGHYHFQNGWDFAPHASERADTAAHLLDLLEALSREVASGRIGHVGLSNETAWGISSFMRLAEKHDLPRIVSIQNEYSLLRREFDLDLAEAAHHEDVGLLAYSPLAAGALSGKYAGGAVPKGSRAEYQKGMWRLSEHSTPVIDLYLDIARRHGLDPAQMAIAFCLTRPFMASVLVGATSLDQLRTNIAAHDLKLSVEVLAEIEAVHRRHPRPL